MGHLNRDLKLIYLSNLFFSLGMGLYTMILPAHIRSLGAGPVELGYLGSLAMLLSTVSFLPGAYVTDRIDRRTLMIVGWAMCTPAPIFYALASDWRGVIPGYVLFNLSMFSNLALQTYVLDAAPPDRVSFTYTLIFSAFAMGMIFSQVVGGLLTRFVAVRTIFYLSAIFYALSTSVFFMISPNKPHQHVLPDQASSSWHAVIDKRILALTAVFSLVYIVIQLPSSFIVPFLQDRAHLDLFWISALGAANSMAAALIGPKLGELADRIGQWRVLALDLALWALAYWLQASFPVLSVLATSFVVRGAAPLMNLMTSHVGQTAPAHARGLVLAFYALVTGLVSTAAPWIGGQLYTQSPSRPFSVTVVVALALSGLFILWQLRLNAAARSSAPGSSEIEVQAEPSSR